MPATAPARPLTLAIDTSGPLCAAGLYDGSDERARTVLDLGRGHAERVVDACAETLERGGASWGDVAAIVVTVGPGSFTGVRAGVAAARGLALSLGVPARGVTTLEAMAPPDGWAPYLVALDARRGEVYAQGFGADGSPLDTPRAVTPDALARDLSPHPRIVIGSGAPTVVEAMRSISRDAAIGTRDGRPVLAGQPDIADVAAAARLAGGVVDAEGMKVRVERPVPLYLRPADAKPSAAPVVGVTPAPPSRDRIA